MGEDDQGSAQSPSSRKTERWYRRPTIRALKKKAIADANRDYTRKWTDRDNRETRLPDDEAVHCGGFVLVEAFTPSTVASLFDLLENWPAERQHRKDDWLRNLRRSRSGSGAGWQNLGLIRPPGTSIFGDGHHDAELPPGVEAVWLSVNFVIPSVAMVVAVFTISEEAGDLSDLLREDYKRRNFDLEMRVAGRFGGLRSRLPWARPKRYGLGYSGNSAEDEKRAAAENLVRRHETECSGWFYSKFRGRFSTAQETDRPRFRMFFTHKATPFSEREPWWRPVGLDFAIPLWLSSELDGWYLTDDRFPERNQRYVMRLVAKRSEAADGDRDGIEDKETNWYLTQAIASEGTPLAARHALWALLGLYADELAALRDRAGLGQHRRHPVREGRALDEYLVKDGLDSATITADAISFTEDLVAFRWSVPEFTESRNHLPEKVRKNPPAEFVPGLFNAIRRQATRLANDTRTTTENIKASAELRQAISNTRLQRLTMLLSGSAVVIAVVTYISSQ